MVQQKVDLSVISDAISLMWRYCNQCFSLCLQMERIRSSMNNWWRRLLTSESTLTPYVTRIDSTMANWYPRIKHILCFVVLSWVDTHWNETIVNLTTLSSPNGAVSFNSDNLRCHQRRQRCQINACFFSMTVRFYPNKAVLNSWPWGKHAMVLVKQAWSSW